MLTTCLSSVHSISILLLVAGFGSWGDSSGMAHECYGPWHIWKCLNAIFIVEWQHGLEKWLGNTRQTSERIAGFRVLLCITKKCSTFQSHSSMLYNSKYFYFHSSSHENKGGQSLQWMNSINHWVKHFLYVFYSNHFLVDIDKSRK